jgi:hypothetical protein
MSETDAAEAKRRAEWLHRHKAHKDWIILSVTEIAVIRAELEATERERDEAREAFKIVYNERVQMELERDEWKNKAYSHATDYTLMEAKCFRLEQQLKEYDKLKS